MRALVRFSQHCLISNPKNATVHDHSPVSQGESAWRIERVRTLSGLSHLIGWADSAGEIALFARKKRELGMLGTMHVCLFGRFLANCIHYLSFFSIEIKMGCVSDAPQ